MPRIQRTWSDNDTSGYVPKAILDGGIDFLCTPPTEDTLKTLEEDIQNHLETRIHLFFIQLVLVNKTGLKFSIHDTTIQIGSGKVESKKKTENTGRSQYAAAHCSTLPSLKCSKEGKEVVYLSNSSFHSSQNQTILLPAIVNHLDTTLDGKTSDQKPKLRQKSVAILNEAASLDSTKTPADYLLLFTEALSEQLKEVEEKPLRDSIVERYKQITQIYTKKLSSQTSRIELIRKLCFKAVPEKEGLPLDKKFYRDIQKEMMKLVTKEEEAVAPPVVRKSRRKAQLPAEEEFDPLTPVETKYINYCLTVEKVKKLAKKCFKDRFLIRSFETFVKETIKKKYNKIPQNIDLITSHLLKDFK